MTNVSDDIDILLTAHFRPVETGVNPARAALATLREEWDPRAYAESLHIEASDRGVLRVDDERPAAPASGRAARLMVERAREELADYFAGRRAFFSVPVDLGEIRPFQRKVLDLACRIPFGETRTYSWIARRIGHPLAVRAVGTALGRNPVPFIVPCHRVLRNDGALGGYGLGLPMKVRLLGLERSTHVLEGCTTTGILCRTGCPHALRVRDDRRVVFASIEDARSVGYRPCKVCRPDRVPADAA